MTIIEEYIEKLQTPYKSELMRIREIVLEVVPDAEEIIGYGMPGFKYHGKAFFGFDLHKEHIGIYPYGGETIEILKDALREYALSKGTIKVPLDKPIPETLLREIIKTRLSLLRK